MNFIAIESQFRTSWAIGFKILPICFVLLALLSTVLIPIPAKADWRVECKSDPIQDFKYCKV